jgi:hypothetical protein
MTLRNFLIGVWSSLVAAGFVWWVTEHNLIPGLLMVIAGVIGLGLTQFFLKKPGIPNAASPIVSQDVKLEVSPQVTINPQVTIGIPAAGAPVPTLSEQKDKPRCNIHFEDVWYGDRWQGNPLARFAGQTLSFATAKFENVAIDGVELRTPRVKARAIYRRANGTVILDLPNIPWVPGRADQSETIFEASVPRYVLLFFRGDGRLLCRSVESVLARIAGRKQYVSEPRDYQLEESPAGIDVLLLTATERLYSVRLSFTENPDSLPEFTGYEEL